MTGNRKILVETCCSWWGRVYRGVSEDSVVGAIVIKYINCLEKGMECLLVPSAAVTLVLVAGFSAESL